MKIGILTFHWATNYGAVLQTFALQEYLKENGHEVNVINYIPHTGKIKFLSNFKTKKIWMIPKNLLVFVKEININKFRNSYLNLSQIYCSESELLEDSPRYDVYICGSDQIWNPYFTLNGENCLTLSYFLNFGHDNVKRIAYAASFGCMDYPKNLFNSIWPVLSKFNAISVREKTGCLILNRIGFSNIPIMPDPTLLLKISKYKCIIKKSRKREDDSFFYYSLHDSQLIIKYAKLYLLKNYYKNIFDTGSFINATISVDQWLAGIESTAITVTNSYHGMIFSILFKKPFIVVPVEGHHEGMNDRIFTLLERLDLQDRLLKRADSSEIDAILTHVIDWNKVDLKILDLQEDAHCFFEKHLCRTMA